MSDAVVVVKVGGVNPSGAAAVVNPTPESEMDALLLGRTGVSDRTRQSIHSLCDLDLHFTCSHEWNY